MNAARATSVLALCIVSGCQGNILSPAASGDTSLASNVIAASSSVLPDGSSDPLGADVRAIVESDACKSTQVGVRAPLRALTPVQFGRSVQALFDGKIAVPSGYPALVGASMTGFSTDSALNTLTGSFAEGLSGVADTIALSVMDNLSAVLSCASSANRSCAEQFVDTYAQRAFRRPLAAEERSAMLAQYDDAMGDHGDFAVAIGELASTLVQHPLFVYLPEIGSVEGDQRKLDDYEVASRLSFLFWNSPPDAALLAAAARGELATADGVGAQSRRMLGDARFADVLRDFTRQWLSVKELAADAKDSTLFPEFDAALAGAMSQELDRFVGAAVAKGEGGFGALMSGRDTFVNADMAALYGAPNAAAIRDWTPVTLGEERAGVLSRAALLASFAGPAEPSHVRRGKVVRTALLCDRMAPPPAGAEAMQPHYPAEADTRRKRSAILQQTSPCATCHTQMDPIGLAFDDFDALGKHLGGAVDVSGEVQGNDDIGGEFNGAAELAERLADSDQVMECAGRQWFRYAFGRFEESADACTFAPVAYDLSKSKGDLRGMFTAAALAPGFRFRKTTEI